MIYGVMTKGETMNKSILIASLVLIGGCSTTYQAPSTDSQHFSGQHDSDKKAVIEKAKKILLMDGYQIQSASNTEGYISTSYKNWKLSPEQASCGSTMGIDYLKDNRTKTEVAINIIVDEETLSVRSNIKGEYKPGTVSQDITLTCVSNGVIESDIAEQIISN